ncbi:phosphopentomutase [Helicoverpa armigera]|uniref:phosphopentomutase n=1 Tax=Helicoverpa armigera TaxID=29058 RepID=UPI0030829F9F
MSVCDSGDAKLDAAVNSWLKHDKNPTTRKEVLDDISNARWDKLRGCMLQRLKFGTAGLRGRMGAGYKAMNDVVVLQTAQGLCSYVKKVCNPSQIQNGVVIGFDGRYNSKRFAELTAKVFISSSIPVHMFTEVCATPLVSFGTILYNSVAGVMVTASHNPKEDNGYKVYWRNGCQIISPHDDNVLDEIMQCLDIPDEHWDIKDIRSNPLVTNCQEEVTNKYMDTIISLSPEVLEENKRASIDVVYSAMHGVGYEYVLKAFATANLKAPISVKEQQDPNPDFPTVTFPNPEELECLNLSKQLAEEKKVKLVLVNDPDADRLAVAEFDDSTNSWHIFTGNEMGALLGWWLLDQYCKKVNHMPESEVYIMASIVSSKMLRAIVKGRGEFVETLTGFKWMGNTTLLLAQQNKVPLFAFEEAIGYMCDHRVPEKDGVSAAVQVASLASHLYLSGSSVLQQLYALYAQYGYHVTDNSYYICHEQATIQKIFRRIRNYTAPGEYPKKVGECEIVYINDFTAGVKIPENVNGEAHLNVLGTGLDQDYTSGEMIIFRCSNGLTVTVRTSGTEPKLKYYSELVCEAKSRSEQESMNAKLKVMVKAFVEELLQPRENGLLG